MKASNPVRSLCSVALALGVVFAHGVPTYAAGIPGYPDDIKAYDPREVAMLPRYCIYTQSFRERVPGGNNPAEVERLTSEMGPGYIHMHHYCRGLMNTNRAILLARTRRDRMFYLHDSISEFDYVIREAPKDFVLLPEILTKKGENLIRLGRGPHGILELQRAIELKPDYWPPYAYLSDYYKEIGDPAQAREWLERGLAAAPDAKALQRRLAELGPEKGGKAAPPKPAAKKAEAQPGAEQEK